jgi:hypothetical protein
MFLKVELCVTHRPSTIDVSRYPGEQSYGYASFRNLDLNP